MMRYYNINGNLVKTIGVIKDAKEITIEEYETLLNEIKSKTEEEYWNSISYEDAVDMKIREKYTVSQEFAILRQKDEKPEEYAAYYEYCEECKAFVKAKKGI